VMTSRIASFFGHPEKRRSGVGFNDSWTAPTPHGGRRWRVWIGSWRRSVDSTNLTARRLHCRAEDCILTLAERAAAAASMPTAAATVPAMSWAMGHIDAPPPR